MPSMALSFGTHAIHVTTIVSGSVDETKGVLFDRDLYRAFGTLGEGLLVDQGRRWSIREGF